ncbi:PREDICTED: sodium/nucleoside cotransporter 2-like [Thamnophis sirtalis]|uniref:Sodium/nucleoside cotransporter 2-like n=1 Tax=Thamnophis sirtalis TaxID=35019 RepID=A0A6I9YM55_9SAUR|nr:PREDICTED: sodium/nucleoside cotransporter 2-like [Thamnophis sirtalis]XP_013925312.1 PREDICTED: sodium/nucleoside cotransporter 2-like [Thamnophis sirtalis]
MDKVKISPKNNHKGLANPTFETMESERNGMGEVKISPKNSHKGLANPTFELMESETNGKEAPSLGEENPVQDSHFGSRLKNVTQPFSKAKRFCKAHRKLFHQVFLGILIAGKSFTLRAASGDHRTPGSCNCYKYMSVAKCLNFDGMTMEIPQWL